MEFMNSTIADLSSEDSSLNSSTEALASLCDEPCHMIASMTFLARQS